MDRRSEELLGLDEVRRMVADRCGSPWGRARAATLAPSPDPVVVATRQSRTAEARELERLGLAVAAGARDIEEPVDAASRGGTLDVDSLSAVAAAIRVIREIADGVRGHAEAAPALAEDAARVDAVLLARLEAAIDGALDGHGGVRDSASIELAQTRRALAAGRSQAADTLRDAAQRVRPHLQEGFITERAGRPVLAVKASSRSAVPGIVHDRSGSGQTIFVEPMDVVDANNRVRELEALERIEVERVLARLSSEVGEIAVSIRDGADAAGELDLALAGATLSREWSGRPVEVGDLVELRAARHPLLDPDRAVPIDLPLGGIRALVVSGPNAGGKTVALKTLGLLALAHQCGLQLPAGRAALPVFDLVLADIGDDQSIERSLSTFSGHVRRLVEILSRASGRSLVLLDEVAAGTDPAEGAALARAVIEALVASGALVLATTHHHELKAWASSAPGVANAAVGFDAERLAPTFEVRVGEPGASHAIEVAERLGLDGAVVDAARRIGGEEREGVEALLREAAAARARAEAERDRALVERDEAARVRAQVERREAELAARLERIRAEGARERERARDEARRELAEARSELAALRAEIAAARRAERRRATRQDAAEHASERDRRLGAAVEAGARAERRLSELARPAHPATELAVGDRVLVADLGVSGTVTSIDGDTVEVQGPSARLRLNRARLVRDARVDATPPAAPPVETRPVARAIGPEVDVRGQRADAACAAVREYVDAAAMAGLETVRIVHGRGTGALRAAVRDELDRHPLVARAQIAGPDEGGDGATIATLR